jgi:hypothetical protein
MSYFLDILTAAPIVGERRVHRQAGDLARSRHQTDGIRNWLLEAMGSLQHPSTSLLMRQV